MVTGLSIICYLAAWSLLLLSARRKTEPGPAFFALLALGCLSHAIAAWREIISPEGVQIGVFQIASALCLVMNLIVLLSSIRLPLMKIFLLLLPLASAASGSAALIFTAEPLGQHIGPGVLSHILLSIIAYSLLTIATLQALLLAYQQSQLKAHHASAVLGVFPPLQTMESLMFDLVRAGFVSLSLSLVSGFIFIDNVFEQQLSHKMTFSIVSWLIYAVLLFGRHALGWRGKVALRWMIAGFIMLMLAYFGSKFVIEVLLD
ncbi:cytochrome C assembly family protein [Agaribacterium haliotis]|uniref:cytochrome C assembly family protein n=1 Tax=Agaribacterium haliotis TaxID=2013869 RepID=UPI000BB5838E|nr:cytochrome c biogenesis protein CcsA [Agaribacterium haliotis]